MNIKLILMLSVVIGYGIYTIVVLGEINKGTKVVTTQLISFQQNVSK